MATLILQGDEILADFITVHENGNRKIYVDDIDVILHMHGKDTKVLKSSDVVLK